MLKDVQLHLSTLDLMLRPWSRYNRTPFGIWRRLSRMTKKKKWPDCIVQVRKIHPTDATARWDDTRPKSPEIQRAPLMPTQFVWQWLSGDGALVDVICQHYAHLTQQLRPWGSRESVVMILQLKKLKWQVCLCFCDILLEKGLFFSW